MLSRRIDLVEEHITNHMDPLYKPKNQESVELEKATAGTKLEHRVKRTMTSPTGCLPDSATCSAIASSGRLRANLACDCSPWLFITAHTAAFSSFRCNSFDKPFTRTDAVIITLVCSLTCRRQRRQDSW